MKIAESLVNTPHHDGSELYVSNAAPLIGEQVTLKVRVPSGYQFSEAFIRVYEDSEPRIYKLKEKSSSRIEKWLEVKIVIHNIHTIYRFVFIGEGKYQWLNAYGLFDHDGHSNNDF